MHVCRVPHTTGYWELWRCFEGLLPSLWPSHSVMPSCMATSACVCSVLYYCVYMMSTCHNACVCNKASYNGTSDTCSLQFRNHLSKEKHSTQFKHQNSHTQLWGVLIGHWVSCIRIMDFVKPSYHSVQKMHVVWKHWTWHHKKRNL